MPLLLFIAFIVVPIAELWVIMAVGDMIGLVPTLMLLLAVSIGGAWLVKREGRSAWKRFRAALGTARVPAVEVVDGALVLIGGTLLLTPGFLTDVTGLFLVIPPSRALVNRFIRSRVRGRFGLGGTTGRAGTRARRNPEAPEPAPLDVEVVDVRRDDPRG